MRKTRYRIFLTLVVYFFSSFSWARTSLDVATDHYRRYDQNGGKKTPALVGLRLDAMMEAKKYAEAKALLGEQLKNPDIPKAVIHWRLAQIANLERKAVDVKKHLEQTLSLPLLNNSELARSLYSSLPTNDKDWLVKKLVDAGFFKPSAESVCPYFELEQRKRRADFLWDLKKNHSMPPLIGDAIFKELFITTPEVVVASDLMTDDAFSTFYKARTLEEIKKRIEYLFLFGKNDEARKTIQEYMKREELTPKDTCDLRYEDAKVERKLRHYAEARNRFTELAADKQCSTDIKIKARFMNLMLMSMKGDDSKLAEFDAFVKDFPAHSFADDVMIFKVNILLEKNLIDAALVELEKIITQYPQGDMIDRALFLKSFTLARHGRTAESLVSLEALKKLTTKDSLEYAQASYWSARLTIFDDLKTLNYPRVHVANQAKADLFNLVQSPTPTVYSWLSWLLLDNLSELKKQPRRPQLKDSVVSPSKNQNLLEIQKLVAFGFRTEALLLLEDFLVSATNVDDASTVAYLYSVLNKPEAGHQKLVRCDASLATRLRQKIPATYARISYPRPYAHQVSKASSKNSVPSSVVFSIMRQESGFLAQSRSWANARGLMQLIYNSAKSQAKKCDLAPLTEDDLYLPEKNILLGTSLIQKYWQDFGTIAVALAAYNAGPSAAKNWLKKNGDAPIDTFIEGVSFKETRSYIKHVLGSMWIYSRNYNEKALPQLQFKAIAIK